MLQTAKKPHTKISALHPERAAYVYVRHSTNKQVRENHGSRGNQYVTARLYAESGARATDDPSVAIFQGRSVGGGTTVNWMIMLRTPPYMLEAWEAEHGLYGMSRGHQDGSEVICRCGFVARWGTRWRRNMRSEDVEGLTIGGLMDLEEAEKMVAQ